MRTQFFQDMVDKGSRCVLVSHPNVLYLEQVAGVDKARELAASGSDEDNPYTHPKVYRAMLREQYLVLARLRAGKVTV